MVLLLFNHNVPKRKKKWLSPKVTPVQYKANCLRCTEYCDVKNFNILFYLLVSSELPFYSFQILIHKLCHDIYSPESIYIWAKLPNPSVCRFKSQPYLAPSSGINISSVLEFQRWWVLKSKLFAQESRCSKETLNTKYFEPLMIFSRGSFKNYVDKMRQVAG